MSKFKKEDMTFLAHCVVPKGQTADYQPRNERGHVQHSEYQMVRKLWLGVARAATSAFQEVGLAHVKQGIARIVMFGWRTEVGKLRGSDRLWMDNRYWEIDGEPGLADDVFAVVRLVSAPTCTIPDCPCCLPPVFDGSYPRPHPSCGT